MTEDTNSQALEQSPGTMSSIQTASMADMDTEYKGYSGRIEGSSPRGDSQAQSSGYWDAANRTSASSMSTRLISTLSNAQPAASALNRSKSVLHARAKSLVAYMPRFAPNAATNATLPTTPERSPPSSRQSTNKIFGDLFNGESAPVRLGLPQSPMREDADFVLDYNPGLTERPESNLRRRQTNSVDNNSRKSWFVRKSTVPTVPQPSLATDELLNMDVNSALFPHGPADPHSPHAFNDLLLNATALLERLQTAYREKATCLANFQPEIDAQREEVEEVETRSRHLKLQLEGMCRKAEEQERTMQEMAEQLAQEKLKLQDEKDRAAKSIRLIRTEAEESARVEGLSPRSRRKRVSDGSSATDSGFESNADSASVMSGDGREDRSHAQPLQTLDMPFVTQQRRGRGNDGSLASANEALRRENQQLQAQMEVMQRTLQGCIDFVGSVTI